MDLNNLGIYTVSLGTKYYYFIVGSHGNFLIGANFLGSSDLNDFMISKGGVSKIFPLGSEENIEFYKQIFVKFGAAFISTSSIEEFNSDYRIERWKIDYSHIDFKLFTKDDIKSFIYYSKKRKVLFLGPEVTFLNNQLHFESNKVKNELLDALLEESDFDYICGTNVNQGSSIIPLTGDLLKKKFDT